MRLAVALATICLALILSTTVAETQAETPANPSDSPPGESLKIDSRLGRLLDATLTAPGEGVRTARLAAKSAYRKRGLEPPPFLEHLLTEVLPAAEGGGVAISSLEPIYAERFQIVLSLNGKERILDFRLEDAALPERLPEETPLMEPGEVLSRILNQMALTHGVERAEVLLEMQRLAQGSVHRVGDQRLMLRFPDGRWSPGVLKGLRDIARKEGEDLTESFRLADEKAVLRGLLSRGLHELDTAADLLAEVRRVEQLEDHVADLNRDLEDRDALKKREARIWWLEHRLWWIVAGVFLFMAVVTMTVRALLVRGV